MPLSFLNEGAKVVVADVFPEWSEPYIQDLRENPNCVCFQCNLESTDEIKAAYDTCISEFGGFNTLLNIACYGRAWNLETMSYEDWNSMFDGCIGYVSCDQAAIPYLKKERKQRDCKYLFHVWPGITRLQDLRGQRTE